MPDGIFALCRCTPADLVYCGRGSWPTDFFYMYARMMKDSCILIPFDDFCSGVLHTLNVAPTQLHPNSWAYKRAFQLFCSTLAIISTIPLFLYHYLTRPGRKVGWLSLVSHPRNCLFKPYLTSYKFFKDTFVKISFESGGREYIFHGNEPKFPLYWTRSPLRFAS